ncbi:MAG: SRPBCC family protein [Solirubrobacteraceae bacterium MAG38_C4-C5]|nr:SRPBCC family protein [Candidatus Siliceabacter maunaloa]
MRVHNVHARDLAAPPETVAALLDGLGGAHDRLWPSAERWPTSQLALERPLAVGASGGHDPRVRYTVETYEPGRRVVFRFAPGVGLVGTHGFEVEALDAGRSRLTHTLACRVEPKLRALWPVVRRQHDALIEDSLDQAELAVTGRIAQPARWPLVVRAANRFELSLARSKGELPPGGDSQAARARTDHLARLSAVAVPSTLAGLAALHAAWALGWRWPGGDETST